MANHSGIILVLLVAAALVLAVSCGEPDEKNELFKTVDIEVDGCDQYAERTSAECETMAPEDVSSQTSVALCSWQSCAACVSYRFFVEPCRDLEMGCLGEADEVECRKAYISCNTRECSTTPSTVADAITVLDNCRDEYLACMQK